MFVETHTNRGEVRVVVCNTYFVKSKWNFFSVKDGPFLNENLTLYKHGIILFPGGPFHYCT
jgi:hypothetical protein